MGKERKSDQNLQLCAPTTELDGVGPNFLGKIDNTPMGTDQKAYF